MILLIFFSIHRSFAYLYEKGNSKKNYCRKRDCRKRVNL